MRKAGIGGGGPALAEGAHPDTELHDRPALLNTLCKPSQGPVPGRSYPAHPALWDQGGGLPRELSHGLQRKSSERDGPRRPRPGHD